MGVSALERHLLSDQILSEEKLAFAKSEAQRTGAALIDVIATTGLAAPEAVYRSLANFCEMRFVQPSKIAVDPTVAKEVPARFATHYKFVPLEIKNNTLVLAVSDPLDTHRLDDIRLMLKRRIEAVVATPAEIERKTKEV